jgi:lysozyme
MPQDNAAGISLTEQFEGCELTAYWDAYGKVWTIGYGHTGPDVHEGMTITQEQATALLKADLATAEAGVQSLTAVNLTPNQFAALVDFAYNEGVGQLAGSTLMRLVNAGNFKEAAEQFGHWVYAGGQVLSDLVRRRAAEKALFLTP